MEDTKWKEKPARYRQPYFNARVNLVRREGNIYSEAPQKMIRRDRAL